MATIDTDLLDALTAANVPPDKARAAAAAIETRIASARGDLVTNLDLGHAVDRLEGMIRTEVQRSESRIAELDQKIDLSIRSLETRMTMLTWMIGLQVAATLGVLWKLMR